MRTLSALLAVICLSGISWAQAQNQLPLTVQRPATATEIGSKAQVRLVETYGKLPLSFEANQGQTDPRVKFLSRGSGYTLFLTSNQAVLALMETSQKSKVKGQKSETSSSRLPNVEPLVPGALRLTLAGANPATRVSGLDELPGKSNYFVGNDPAKWRTNVPNYAKVKYEAVYRGVDLVYYGNQQQVEYDFVVAPGADLRAINLSLEGAESIRLDEKTGDLILKSKSGEMRFHRPVVYQPTTDDAARTTDGASKHWIDGRYVLKSRAGARGRGRIVQVGFRVPSYDRRKPLIIDPVLSYSTYLGGTGFDFGRGVAVDTAGNAYVTGYTSSSDFPTKNPLQAAKVGGFTVFVTKLNAAGSALVYSTYLGGSSQDFGHAIAVDASGNAYLTGSTTSTDFPTASPLQAANAGGADVFVTKLNATGSALVYSTYLGGGGDDDAFGIALDTAGNSYVTGSTDSANFPTMKPLQPANGGGSDAFVTKLNAAGTAFVYSTYLGGSGSDQGAAIAVDASGSAYVTGNTDSTNFPKLNPVQPATGGLGDAFVTKLNPAGSGLVYSTYLGGSGTDNGFGIAVDGSGSAYVAGSTQSLDFPTVNPLQAAYAGGNFDVFVTKLSAAGSTLVYSTYLGGSGDDFATGIAVDKSGNAYLAGLTSSIDFPTASPVQAANAGGSYDAFVTELNAAGSALSYSTYLGGSGDDDGFGIAVDGSGAAYVVGFTASPDFPTASPVQAALAGAYNVFVAKIASAAAAPAVSLSATGLVFGDQPLGTTSTAQSVTLTNAGNAALSISSLTVSGDFAKTDNCGTSLAAQANCQIDVTFKPMALGARTGVITVTANASGSPFWVSLSGNGTDTTAPTVSISVSPSILWPPNGQWVRVLISGTIWDSGSGVNSSSAGYSVVDEYGVIHPHGGITLGAGGSYSVTIPLQAWRLEDDRDGRQYKVFVSAKDNAGNPASVSTVVTVPHDHDAPKADPKQPDEPRERNPRRHGRRHLED